MIDKSDQPGDQRLPALKRKPLLTDEFPVDEFFEPYCPFQMLKDHFFLLRTEHRCIAR